MSGTYWRSQRQIDGDPEFQTLQEREFPEGASEPPDGITRRDLMTLLGASLSLAGLSACRRPIEHIVPYVTPPEEIIPGVPRFYATTMPFGRSAYGLIVESHEGRPTKIEGNPVHPSTLGASSVRTQASVLGLYDPDRSQHVLLSGQPKSWADFTAAWAAIEKTHLQDGGAGLALLTESFASPTLARLAAAFRARFPKATWATWEPVSDENALEGLRRAAGRPLDAVLRVERARVILSLDADLFATDPESILHARGFSAGRKTGADGGEMNRLYAVEAVFSPTGIMADHRLRLATSRIPGFLMALAQALAAADAALGGRLAALGLQSQGATAPDGEARAFLQAVAGDLVAAKGKGLIAIGPRQPPEAHAAVAALNVALGNAGETVIYKEPAEAAVASGSAFASLVAAMRGGAVKTLVILGGNPVYSAPADLEFGAAMKKVPVGIVLGDAVDETSALATWHVPRAHFLESWGDARAFGGTLSVVQPLILPLYGGKSAVETLGLLATGKDAPGYDLVRDTWKPLLGAADFERHWSRVLHDGLFAGSETAAVVPAIAGRPLQDLARAAADGAGDGFELVFQPSAAIHDGRYANDSWLQELPDPITKVVWDNPALLSPATARSLGVANEDLVRIDSGGRSLTLPAFVVPGQADGTVVLTLGYGRTGSGRVGNGAGFDAGALRTMTALGLAKGARVTRAGGTYDLASTQEHGSMEGHPIILEAPVEEFRAHPEFAQEAAGEDRDEALFTEKTYDKGHQWGMSIDLNRCVGCNACMVACQSENNVPVVGRIQVRKGRVMHWIRVDRYFTGDPEGTPQAVVQPVPCMQCENAPCEQVCPVAATVHDEEGLNVMVYNRCIGTRYCSNNCPYKVRRFNFFNFTKDTPESLKLAQNPDVTVRARGVMEKCTYCVQRINAGKIDAKLHGRELKDGDIKTACQQACPAEAITFGDLRLADSQVAKTKKDPRNYGLLNELHTRPRTTYLARLRNPHPSLAAKGAAEGGHA
ncbi:MAG TPA: TAT-variant-translocated molybdopterin oxidoreductase [Patescibacteria group bacterium]|nr:TAT-variant-translocated molybdopterin oxidoreductase [Patescibacteria group bacterium]